MPFEPRANPDLAGQFMYAGISSFGEGVAKGVSGAIEGFQKKSKERKAYMGLGEAMLETGELKKEQWEALKNADTDTLKGTLDGLKAAGVLKQMKLHNKLSEQQIATLEFHTAEQRKTAAGQARFNELMQARMTPPQGPTPGGEPMTTAAIEPNEIYRMAAKAGMPITRDTVDMGEAFERYGRPGTVTPVPGQPNLNFVWQTPKSGSLVPSSKTGKVLAPAEEWIVTDDVDLFKGKITAIKDPQTRDAILAARRQYNLAIGKTEDPLAQIIAELLGGRKEKTAEGKGSKGAKAPEKKPASPWERYQNWGK